jgi:hypothetical protein
MTVAGVDGQPNVGTAALAFRPIGAGKWLGIVAVAGVFALLP